MIKTVITTLVAAIIVICLALAARASATRSPASVEAWSPASSR